MGSCRHKDCAYRMREELSHGDGPKCDYLGVTGKLRLQAIAADTGKSTQEVIRSGLWAADKCPLYCKGDRARKAELSNFRSRPRLSPYEEAKRRTLYSSGLSDHQIAAALGVSPSTIFSWRQQRKLKANYPGKPDRKEISL